MLAGIMNNWLIDYHHALQIRLLGLLVIFGVVFPVLCVLATAGHGMAKRFAAGVRHGTGHLVGRYDEASQRGRVAAGRR
jgi:hypothetical protein